MVITRRCQRLNPGSNPGQRIHFVYSPLFFDIFLSYCFHEDGPILQSEHIFLFQPIFTVTSAKWYGSDSLKLTYEDASGRADNRLLYRDDESQFDIETEGRPWSFLGDSKVFRMAAEARRIRLAHLFDPLLAIHTSLVDPLPHQITAVYDAMITRQPLRFLFADDPGAGKTIMAGLLIKELIARGDLQRCLIVCPGNLVEQWQDEMDKKFNIPFEIMTTGYSDN